MIIEMTDYVKIAWNNESVMMPTEVIDQLKRYWGCDANSTKAESEGSTIKSGTVADSSEAV